MKPYVILICSIVAALCSRAYGQALLWTSRPIARITAGQDTGIVDIRLSHTRGCIYDQIPLQWETLPTEEIRIALVTSGSQDVWISPQLDADKGDEMLPKTSNIKCAINEIFCVPAIENVVAMTKGSPSLSVIFQQETNQPPLGSTKSILEALHISPTLVGAAVGEWTDARTLNIAIEEAYLKDIVGAHSRGQGVTILPRLRHVSEEASGEGGVVGDDVTVQEATSKSTDSKEQHSRVRTLSKSAAMDFNSVSFRPMEVGTYSIFALNTTSLQTVSQTLSYEVVHCEEQITLPTATDTSTLQRERELNNRALDGILGDERRPPTPALRIKGTLAITGKDPIKVPDDLSPGIKKGSFAVSFWIRFLEKPSGAFRALFYKGNGVDAQRTPSAWLLPSTQRLAIRASTTSNPDVGSDTMIDIPLNQWVHLAFSFNNLTAARLQRAEEEEILAAASANETANDNIDNISIVPAEHDLLVNGKPSATSQLRRQDAMDATADTEGNANRRSIKYTITNYVNGKLDIKMQFADEVVGNVGPLHLFKDVSHDGPKAFVRDLIIWDAPISSADVLSIYAAGPLGKSTFIGDTRTSPSDILGEEEGGKRKGYQHYSDGVDEVLDVLASALGLQTDDSNDPEGAENGHDGDQTRDDAKQGSDPVTAVSASPSALFSSVTALIPLPKRGTGSSSSSGISWISGKGNVPQLKDLQKSASETSRRRRYALSGLTTQDASTQTSTAAAYSATVNLAQQLYTKGQASLSACEPYPTREDLYAEAALYGSNDALYAWSMLISHGIEESVSNCGVSEFYSQSSTERLKSRLFEHQLSIGSNHASKSTIINSSVEHSVERSVERIFINDQDRATIALIRVAEAGNAKALVPLAISLLTGVGAQPFMWAGVAKELLEIPRNWEIPLHPSELIDGDEVVSTQSSSSLPSAEAKGEEGANEGASVSTQEVTVSNDLLLPNTGTVGASMDRQRYRTSALHEALAEYVSSAVVECNNSSSASTTAPSAGGYELPVGTSVLCWKMSRSSTGTMKRKTFGGTDAVTRLALGLLHVASLFGVSEADAALFYRYNHGLGVSADAETAAQYGLRSTSVASAEFHRVGGQPIMEADRIDDRTEKEVEKGNKGNDDELIQHQKIRADEGDVPAMIATADLYYYGARGLPRDQPRALQYYSQAASAGDPLGMCGAAAMHLKGEGTEKNVTKAVDLYEEAAALGSVKALNGLGYIYFYGQALPKNETKAYRYFLTAAEAELDGDSLTNAAFCLLHGIGTDKDLVRAAALYDRAARKFGSMSAVVTLASMHMEGLGVARSALTAIPYLSAASNIGPWSAWIRRGLDQYLQDSPLRSLVCYLHAAEMGYEVSQSNAAFIIRRKVKGVVSIPDITIYQPLGRGQVVPREVYVRRYLEARELAMSAFHGNRESSVNIGNLLFEEASKAVATVSGRMRTSKQPATFQTLVNQFFSTSGGRGATGDRRGRVQDVSYGDTSAAVWWYSKASAAGSAMGSMYVGTMHHFGTGVPKNPHRAIRYYDEALRLHSSGADQLQPSILSVTTQMLRWLAATSIGASTSSAPTSNYIQWPFSASSIARPFASTVEWAVYYIWRRYYG